MKNSKFPLAIDEELKERAKKQAKEEERSLTKLIIVAIRRYLDER